MSVLAGLVRWCTGAFVVISIVMHWVRRDLDLFATGISRNQVGPYGAAMSLAFALLGIALVLMAVVFARGRAARALFVTAGLGAIMVALFPLPPDAPLVARVIHQAGGFAMIAGAIAASVMDSSSAAATVIARAGAVVFALFLISGALRETPLGAVMGFFQRATLSAICAWMFVVVRTKGRPDGRPLPDS